MFGGLDFAVMTEALQAVITFNNLFIVAAGVVVGLIVGAIPGLNTATSVALLIPFTFLMPPHLGMSLLIAVFVGGTSGGCVSAVLMKMPGTPASVATVLDGFPMAQKGRGGEAIGHAVFSSLVGTVVSAIFLILAAPALANFALKFYFPEYVAVALFALTAVIALSSDNIWRGVMMALFGMMVATFGVSPVDGLPRFTFGSPAMMGGIALIPALTGLFAVSQIIHSIISAEKISQNMVTNMGSVLPRLSVIKDNAFNYLRSSIIGTLVGVMPALGSGPAGLISYSQAKSSSRHPERFGTGIPEGVIAAETANNATIGGALIIALTLGIPGDPVTAILIGGLMIHGLQPGPELFSNNAEVIYSVYFSLLIGAFFMAAILMSTARIIARIADVPARILAPLLFVAAATGVYSYNQRIFDVIVMVVFGLLGYLFERKKFPLPPLILGLVIGPIMETNFRKMVDSAGSIEPLFTRPIPLVFILMSCAFVSYSIWSARRKSKSNRLVQG